VESVALGLKKIEDATGIRRQILLSFELAESAGHPAERRRLLNFVIVGGGPTGVELAGAIAELARKALACDFRHIDPRQARVILIEPGPRLLATFPRNLQRRLSERCSVLASKSALASASRNAMPAEWWSRVSVSKLVRFCGQRESPRHPQQNGSKRRPIERAACSSGQT
jgi:hypothetical protein